ncbi:ribbon-helix-helix domain-containing protein [Streptococcus sciuri]|uniref:Ribbon-helix-helix domain-containing protein n=1 Tax=Streptococcus sciuri TaxID=2973939 RepID=A0ABT2F7K0_9STRE|nr:ribbon-helix-helix domain-containing protein [Streptococcus sciuri]MCS4488409.1 ribbon-helix-helix domain-containing protein [Streptococcus sciuri]
MAKKMGRPTNDPKDYQMRIRLSETHKNKLDDLSQKTGKTKADIIREGIDLVYRLEK